MRGNVKVWKEEKGFGFILGEDGQDYFVHISNVLGEQLDRGQSVEFDSFSNDKGLSAINVKRVECQKNKFIVIGEERIKASNIKTYGIKECVWYKERIYKTIPIENPAKSKLGKSFCSFFSAKKKFVPTQNWYIPKSEKRCQVLEQVYKQNVLEKNKLRQLEKNEKVDIERIVEGKYVYEYDELLKTDNVEVEKIESHYLYITTYQGDNYRFFEAEYDIEKALVQLDSI